MSYKIILPFEDEVKYLRMFFFLKMIEKKIPISEAPKAAHIMIILLHQPRSTKILSKQLSDRRIFGSVQSAANFLSHMKKSKLIYSNGNGKPLTVSKAYRPPFTPITMM